MSNNISFEDAIVTLKSMFPEWDEETLSTVLVSNNYHVERTIESVLSMCGDSTVNATPAASASGQAANNLNVSRLNIDHNSA
jgi:uncharacterized SAM-binding protein YcdF (DUF218 family)